MERITLILQIITIAISLISMTVTMINKSSENKKDHFLEIVTKERIEELHIVRDMSAYFLALTNPDLLDKVDKQTFVNFISNAIVSIERIKTIFKDIYDEEKELSIVATAIIGQALEYYDHRNLENREVILRLRNDFSFKMSIYDHANWEFIIHQSSGKYSGNSDFMEKYYKSVDEFKNISHP